MGIGMLLFWGLIIVAVVLLVRGLTRSSGSAVSEPRVHERTALDILRERYAKGEIDKSEYEQKRNDLEGSTATSTEQQRRI